MTVSYLRIRWIAVLTVLAIAVVLSACSDPSAPTREPTATPALSDVAEPVTATGPTSIATATEYTGEFVSVSAGGLHTCGVRIDGTVACWGSSVYGEATPPAGQFASISAGAYHNCGVRRDGTVACWGSSETGQATPPEGKFASVSAALFTPVG